MTSRLWLSILFLAVVSPKSQAGEPILDLTGTFLFVTADDSPLILSQIDDSTTIRLVEEGGASLGLRIAPIDSAGVEIGSGRIVVLRPSQKREIRLREEFAAEVLAGARVQIEVLAGGGRVRVAATDLIGRNLLPHPTATTTRRRAAGRPPARPTTVQLIDQAEATGALDSETALLYRVFATFGDARLPSHYRGDDSASVDWEYMIEVRIRYETLSPATRAALLPFLIPPAYQESWANQRGGADPNVSDIRPPCQRSAVWTFVDAVQTPVRVWYRIDFPDLLTANQVASEVDVIWPTLLGLMGRAPVTDQSDNCNGGDSRLDIYLTDLLPTTNRGMLIPTAGCSPSPGYLEVGRFVFSGAPASWRATLTHELFHAFQFAFPLKGCSAWARDYGWWTEASAVWAQDFVDRHADTEHARAPALLDKPEVSLDVHDRSHEYGAYLLPFFVDRSTGSANFVRVAWENCAGDAALEAVDRAISGGFEQTWPAFARANWNEAPADDYVKWDDLAARARRSPQKLRLSTGTTINDIEYELPRLSASYHRIIFNENDSSVAFWNGVTRNLSLRDLTGGELGLQYVTDDPDPGEAKGAHVTALIRMGESWTEEDWTERQAVFYCRDIAAERIDELVLIISNSEFKDREHKLKPPGVNPIVYRSTMGCWQWKGTATWFGPSIRVTANATWTRTAASPLGFSFGAEGSLSWTATDCGASGTLPISGFSQLLTYNFLPPGSSHHRAYETLARGPTISACGNSRTLDWLSNSLFEETILRVKESGKLIEDTSTTDTGANTWQWHFEAQRQ